MVFNKHGYRVLICIRGNCADSEWGHALEDYLNKLVKEYGLDDPNHPQHTTCRVTNCLGVCHSGPILIVHPGAIRYHQVNKEKLERIFQQHICLGQPISELILPYV